MKKYFKVKAILLLSIIFILMSQMSFAATLGDANGDGEVNIVDALVIAQYYVGYNTTGIIISSSDVNCSGTVDIVDALMVAQYYVGLISTFPCTIDPTITPTIAPVRTPTPRPITSIKGSEVLVIGESFIAMSHEITSFLEQHVRNAGLLSSNDRFRDNSVSGMRLDGGGSPTIPQQYASGSQQGQVRYVVMDGGGNDCLQGSCSNPPSSNCQDLQNAVNALKTLLAKMSAEGVEKVVYFWYPEPQSDFGGLKAKLDVLRPMIHDVVVNSVSPKCYWLDLRPVFQGKYSQYITFDGIHPTTAGCQATADAIWNTMQQNNFFGN
jgi:lysophospholipase L1-like esterase